MRSTFNTEYVIMKMNAEYWLSTGKNNLNIRFTKCIPLADDLIESINWNIYLVHAAIPLRGLNLERIIRNKSQKFKMLELNTRIIITQIRMVFNCGKKWRRRSFKVTASIRLKCMCQCHKPIGHEDVDVDMEIFFFFIMCTISSCFTI